MVVAVLLLGAGFVLLVDKAGPPFGGLSFTKSVNVQSPGQDHAIYYRLKVNLAYKGEPLDFDIVVGCRVRITTYKDNDRTVEVGVAPMVHGLKMKDGRGVVVRPPEACRGETTENGKVPKSLLPLVATYENADQPWFGLAYASEDAYASPISELKFFGATISKATREEWQEWRRTEAAKNFITYELLGMNEKNRWDKPRWKPGYRAMGSICYGFSRVKLPESVREAIRSYWPASRPDYWYANGAAWDAFYSAADYHGRKVLFEGSPLSEQFPVESNFFPGLPRHKPGALIFFAQRVIGDVYPASSDLSMNRLDDDGQPSAEVRAKPRKSHFDGKPRPELKGFAFCDVVGNIDGLPAEISNFGNPNANRINGQQINEELNRETGDFGHAFERDEFVLFSERYSLANIFGGGIMSTDNLSSIQFTAALAEIVYHRAQQDDPITYESLGAKAIPLDTPPTGLVTDDPGTTFYSPRGFVGQVVEKGDTFYVVFRGTDLSASFSDGFKAGLYNGLDQTAQPDEKQQIDPGDIANDLLLGVGTANQTQFDDALALTRLSRKLQLKVRRLWSSVNLLAEAWQVSSRQSRVSQDIYSILRRLRSN